MLFTAVTKYDLLTSRTGVRKIAPLAPSIGSAAIADSYQLYVPLSGAPDAVNSTDEPEQPLPLVVFITANTGTASAVTANLSLLSQPELFTTATYRVVVSMSSAKTNCAPSSPGTGSTSSGLIYQL